MVSGTKVPLFACQTVSYGRTLLDKQPVSDVDNRRILRQ